MGKKKTKIKVVRGNKGRGSKSVNTTINASGSEGRALKGERGSKGGD
ncbi:hypothetical protein [Lentzea sp. NPDC051838]